MYAHVIVYAVHTCRYIRYGTTTTAASPTPTLTSNCCYTSSEQWCFQLVVRYKIICKFTCARCAAQSNHLQVYMCPLCCSV